MKFSEMVDLKTCNFVKFI